MKTLKNKKRGEKCKSQFFDLLTQPEACMKFDKVYKLHNSSKTKSYSTQFS